MLEDSHISKLFDVDSRIGLFLDDLNEYPLQPGEPEIGIGNKLLSVLQLMVGDPDSSRTHNLLQRKTDKPIKLHPDLLLLVHILNCMDAADR